MTISEKTNSTSESCTSMNQPSTTKSPSDVTSPSSNENLSRDVQDKVSGKTVMYLLYLMYKANILPRNHLTMLFKAIKEQEPEDITKFLVEEERKRG